MTDPNQPAETDPTDDSAAHSSVDQPDTDGEQGDSLLPPRRSDRHTQQAPAQSSAASSDSVEVGDEADDEEPKKKAGCFKVGCLTVLSMFLVTALAIGCFAAYLSWKLDNNIKHTAMLPTGNQPERNAGAGDAQNILLMGSDSRGNSVADGSRSDVIQLVHISNGQKTVQVVHFPRDLYVAIPGHGKNKINAAYAFGKVPLLVTTLQNLLGIRIDAAAIIGFEGFAKLTDTLGGVDLYVPQSFSESDFGTWTQGWHHMNGKQALGFVRERHQLKEGDIDRGRNQQAWIKAIMTKTLKAGTLLNPLKLNSIIDDVTAGGNLQVDGIDVQSLGWSMRNLRMSDVTFYTAPFSGFGSDPVAGSIDIVDEAKMKELGKALYDDDFSQYSGSTNALK